MNETREITIELSGIKKLYQVGKMCIRDRDISFSSSANSIFIKILLIFYNVVNFQR